MASSPTILVVEDDPIIRDMIAITLIDEGYEVVDVDGLNDALLALRDPQSIFDGVITDVMLSRRDLGWDVARMARELNPAIAVIYISSHAQSEWHFHGVPSSIMVSKPFLLSELLVALAGQLNIDRLNA